MVWLGAPLSSCHAAMPPPPPPPRFLPAPHLTVHVALLLLPPPKIVYRLPLPYLMHECAPRPRPSPIMQWCTTSTAARRWRWSPCSRWGRGQRAGGGGCGADVTWVLGHGVGKLMYVGGGRGGAGPQARMQQLADTYGHGGWGCGRALICWVGVGALTEVTCCVTRLLISHAPPRLSLSASCPPAPSSPPPPRAPSPLWSSTSTARVRACT